MKPSGMKEIKKILQQRRDELARDYSVLEIGAFGSYISIAVGSKNFIDNIKFLMGVMAKGANAN